MKLGLYDSGLGGLTVLKALLNKNIGSEYIYIGDTYHAPYGDKNKAQLWQLNKKILHTLLNQNIDALVIACNTSAALFINQIAAYIENHHKKNIPIYELIRPTITKLSNMAIQSATVFATQQTVDSHAYKQAMLSHANTCTIIETACPLWVPAIETHMHKKSHNHSYIPNQELARDISNKIKTSVKIPKTQAIVYGCSHYPFFEHLLIKEVKKQGLENKVSMINPAECLANEWSTRLEKPTLTIVPSITVACTKKTQAFTHTVQSMFGVTPKALTGPTSADAYNL